VKKVIILAALGFMAYNASATTVCGELKIEKVMCIRAPCPSLKKLIPTTGQPFAVNAAKGSQAERFLNKLSSGLRSVCIDGQISRETLLTATSIRPLVRFLEKLVRELLELRAILQIGSARSDYIVQL